MIILNILGAIFLAIFFLWWFQWHGRAFYGLYREIKFYRANGWNFTQDSGNPTLMQQEMVSRFHFFPLGVVKILTLLNQIMFVILPAYHIVTTIPYWGNWFD
jgi:hypothetical protein